MINVGQPVLSDTETANVLDVLRSTRLTSGAWVERFEHEFAAYIGAKHAVAVCNGTASLHLALVALGVGPGDEVIIPALSFIATANAVAYTGAKPVIVDVNPDTWCISTDAIERAITQRTKAIIPVHLYGVPADMWRIREIAVERGIAVVEDAAESLGSTYDGIMTGGLSQIGCFSFYGNKVITTGEGGMCVTDSDELAAKLRLYRGQGQSDRRYWHEVIGYNYRMTEIQAAIGCAQLTKIGEFLFVRDAVQRFYHAHLDEFTFQSYSFGDVPNWWAVVVQLPFDVHKTGIMEALAQHGVETRPVFYPINDMPMYKSAPLPVASKISRRGIVLPTHAAMTADDVEQVSEALLEVVRVAA